MKKRLLIFTFLFCSFLSFAYAQSVVKGTITDKKTGEPLAGATIALKNETTGTTVLTSAGLDGTYVFKSVATGKYEVDSKYVSYQPVEKHITVEGITTINFPLEDKSSALNEVNITAHAGKETDQSALNAERRADQVINAVSAKTIEVSPDITIANVTQRVSGVSVERSSNGEAQYAIIRGMDQRYEYTLINGVKVPSPDNKNRYVPLDIFPADIVERLEISKSLTANMEGDAIGGAINLVLKEAPDDFTVHANLGTGYAENFFSKGFTKFDHGASLSTSPRINGNQADMGDFPNNPFHYSNLRVPLATIFGLSIGGRTADKKFGALLTFSYQDTYRQTNGTFFQTEVDPASNQPSITDIETRTYNIEQQRTGVITKFDYRFNPNNKITLDADYINLTQNEYRFSSDTVLLGRAGPGTGSVDQAYRSDRTVQQIYNFNLHGDHHITNEFAINWSAVYSKATANEPDRATLNIATGRARQPDGSVVQDPFTFDPETAQSRVFAKNSDEDKSGYLNLIYTPTIFNTKVEFSGGGMYRDKTRHSIYDEYDLRTSADNTAQTFNGNIDNNSFYVYDPQGTGSNALNYDFTEKIGAAYGQFKFTAGNLLAIGGLRYEHTSQQWETNAPLSILGTDGSIKYFDLMPSLNLKYTLDSKQDIRFSYYSAISRPNFYELIPHSVGDPDADYNEVGNPNLKRITANNFDLRYEFFPKALDQLLVGVFYKNIHDPIEYALELQGHDYVLTPENFGTANNYGFELDATKYIRNFGIRLNYTYTDSQITTDKTQDYRDDQGFLTHKTVSQTRPLQGQSKNIGNLSFLYREPKSGFDAQISAVYTGSRIAQVSPFLDNDIWQKAFTTLDVSADKRLYKGLSLYIKATNLLNTPYELEIHRPYPSTGIVIEDQTAGKNTFVRKDLYEQYYIIGLRYKL